MNDDVWLVDLTGVFFFFSSRRRHTRLQGDWSSDVCSSDLTCSWSIRAAHMGPSGYSSQRTLASRGARQRRWRSEERRVGKSVDLGGRRIIKKKKKKDHGEPKI